MGEPTSVFAVIEQAMKDEGVDFYESLGRWYADFVLVGNQGADSKMEAVAEGYDRLKGASSYVRAEEARERDTRVCPKCGERFVGQSHSPRRKARKAGE